MKQILMLACLLVTFAAAAQKPVVSLHVQPGELDTNWVIDRNVRTFPNGQKVVEEIWTPITGGSDSLMVFLAGVEARYVTAEEEIKRQHENTMAAGAEVKRLRAALQRDREPPQKETPTRKTATKPSKKKGG